MNGPNLSQVLADRVPDWLRDFDFELPEDRIARHPAEPRDASRLLVLERERDRITLGAFREIGSWLGPDDVLVVNETRVLRARLRTRLERTGRDVEALLCHPAAAEETPGSGEEPNAGAEGESAEATGDRRDAVHGDGHDGTGVAGADARHGDGVDAIDWIAMLGPARRLREGDCLRLIEAEGALELRERVEHGMWRVRPLGLDVEEMMKLAGHVPLPPYLDRPDTVADRTRYQTVFASQPGAVAASTAGLHFTPQLLDRLRNDGVRMAKIVLHVGPGTFLPIRAHSLETHEVLPERFEVPAQALTSLREARAAGGRIIPVGTTSVRALETALEFDSSSGAGSPVASETVVRDESGGISGWTDLTITPGYTFRGAEGLITNFHLPRSSLLLLVSAFVGRERLLRAYRIAIDAGFRFYSYGDAMLIV